MQHQRVVARAVVAAEDCGRKRIRPVRMSALFMGVVRTDSPVGTERVLHPGGRMQCVRGLVIRIDQRCRRIWSSIHGLKRRGPSVLRQIVVKQPESRADYSAPAVARRICNTESCTELLAIIMRCAQRKPEGRKQRKR